MQLTHLGHAGVLVDTGSARLLIDPGVMTDVSGVGAVDAVLVTHRHPDHIDVDKLRTVLQVNPRARFVTAADVAENTPGLPPHESARPGDTFDFAGTKVDVVGGQHATVHDRIPGCVNLGFLVDDGAFFHPGDSFHEPDVKVDVLAVAIDGPWLKIAESIDYVAKVRPRVAVPIHEGETSDPAKYVGMMRAVLGAETIQQLQPGRASELTESTIGTPS